MLDHSVYLLYRAGTAAIRLLPLRLLFRGGELLGFIAWLLFANYRKLALRNVTIAFGNEMSLPQRRRLVRRHFRRLGANVLCGVRMTSMSREALLRCVELDVASIRTAQQNGRAIVLVLSHLGNWEAFAQLFPLVFPEHPSGTVFQQLRNRRIDAHVRHARSRTGLELFDRSKGFSGAADLLRRGGVLGILGDQHAGDHGLWTPFFNRLASTTSLPALLAKRSGAALIAGSFQTIGVARWRMSFSEPIDQPNESVDSLTWRGNNAIEQQVRAAPEDWFWVHNRWKTPKPNFLLTHYKRGVFVPPGCAEQLQPFRIAVRAPNWLGDSVISMPAVRALKAGRPDAQVTIIAPEKFAAVWRLIPETHDVIPISRKSVLQVARLLRDQQPFDVAVAFPGSFRAALEIFLGGVPRRVGFRGHCRAWLLNQIVPARQRNGPIDHQVNDYLHLVDVLGGSAKLQLPALATSGLTSNRIGLCPGAEYGPAKRWLPERFAEVAAAINQQRRVEWVLFGTKSDEEIGATIETMLSGNCTNLIGKTSVQQLIDELRRCRLLLTNDTGTMHLATLLGIPVVAIFGSTEPQLTGPLGKQARVIRHHVECSPCFLRECPIDFRCMHAVGSSEVAAAVLQVLD